MSERRIELPPETIIQNRWRLEIICDFCGVTKKPDDYERGHGWAEVMACTEPDCDGTCWDGRSKAADACAACLKRILSQRSGER